MAEETKKEMTTSKGQEIQKARTARALSPFEEMDRMFEQFFPRSWLRPWRFEWPAFPEITLPEVRVPKVDVIDREAEVVVKAEIPGIEKKDLDITVGEDTVTLKGETRHEEKEKKGEYYRCEISRGAFMRTVGLPAAVDGAKAKASFKDGVLELVIPKVERAKRHTIKVE